MAATGVSIADRSALGVARAAQALDESAWAIQEQVDRGLDRSEEYERAFRKARAANALLYAIGNIDTESVLNVAYEALHAVEDEDILLTALHPQ